MHTLTPLAGIALAALLIFVVNISARRLGRWSLTTPILFMASGWLLGLAIDTGAASHEVLKTVAETTLALVLFTDAAGVRPRQIGAEGALVSRLLLVGLPLTIAAGVVLSLVLWPQMSWAGALLLAAALAPTDAALGAATVLNKAVPTRVRRLLNVESGLNDGLATPVVLFAIAAFAGEESLTAKASIVEALIELGVGVLVGVGVGVAGGRALRWSDAAGWSSGKGRVVAVLMLPLFAYTFAQVVNGNGFIAAFVAGTFYAAAMRTGVGESLELAEGLAEPLGGATWLIFGAIVVPELLVDLHWQEVVFAVASLTVLRMVPVALSLLGSGLRVRTMAFIGWFGPRGLASVVFSLIALESLTLDADLRDILATTTLTIVLSVLLHGASAAWGAREFGAWARRTQPREELAESMEPHGRGPIVHVG